MIRCVWCKGLFWFWQKKVSHKDGFIHEHCLVIEKITDKAFKDVIKQLESDPVMKKKMDYLREQKRKKDEEERKARL